MVYLEYQSTTRKGPFLQNECMMDRHLCLFENDVDDVCAGFALFHLLKPELLVKKKASYRYPVAFSLR
jgi:hypothetical protein